MQSEHIFQHESAPGEETIAVETPQEIGGKEILEKIDLISHTQ